METSKRTATREYAAARTAAGFAADRFRRAQAEYDRTRTMTPEYWQAQDAMAAAWRRYEAIRGY